MDTQKVQADEDVTGLSVRQLFTPLYALVGDAVMVPPAAVAVPGLTPEPLAQLVDELHNSKAHSDSITPYVAVEAVSEHGWPASVYTPSVAEIGAYAPEQELAHR